MIKQAYINGFMRKCAEHGVDGRTLLKRAAGAYPITVYDQDGGSHVEYGDDRGHIPQKTSLLDRAKSLFGVPTPAARAEAAKHEIAARDARNAAAKAALRKRVDSANAQIGDLAGVEPIRFWGDETPGDIDYKISDLNDQIQRAKDERFGEKGWQRRLEDQQLDLDAQRAQLKYTRDLYRGILPEKPTPAFYKLSPNDVKLLDYAVPIDWIKRHKFETTDKNRRRGRALAWKRNQLADKLLESGIPMSEAGAAAMAAYPSTQQ